jgi:antibiotic biosynthesis monooxygenase (ABM) superfamily enzyme
MVLHIVKYDVHPDKVDGYTAWAGTAIPKLLAIQGLVEFRAYRPVSGTSQIVTTFEFADYEAWAAWYGNEMVQKLITERRMFAINEISEIWGPSPIVPQPIRPGG